MSENKLKLNIIVVGAGLGGLGAAISILLAEHKVLILESCSEIGEVGAGIQILPNASKILTYYGLFDKLDKVATRPSKVNLRRWKDGKIITSMDFHDASENKYNNNPFWDFHRAKLHRILLDRALELGAKIKVNSRIVDIKYNNNVDNGNTATVTTSNGDSYTADLVIGADGINSKLRELLLGHSDPPTPTGDLAYRLLIDTSNMLKDPEISHFVKNPQVNYWMGPDCHAVNYVLNGGKEFNMVLLCPDDVPEGQSTIAGSIPEMQNIFRNWDPQIQKCLALVKDVYKWKLCIREGIDNWFHPSGCLVLLGDSVHATLPYLASGAGMAIEDGAVLGECLSRIKTKDEVKIALKIYEKCRQARTRRIVQRGNLQQHIYHLHDGEEQIERDRILSLPINQPGEALVWRDPELGPWLMGYDHIKDVNNNWPSNSSFSETSSIEKNLSSNL